MKNQIWAFVFIAMCQHINAQMISGFLCLVFFLVPLGWHHAFIPRMSTQYRRISTPPARVPKEQTHKSWLLVCVRDCCKRSLEKLKSNKRLRTTLTKNGELFSSTFDLIIYFCVVEFVQIWGAVKAHCQIASSLPFFCFFLSPPPSQSISAPSTHGQTQPPSSPPVQDMSMYLMMLMVVVLTTTARSFLAFFYFILILFFIYKGLVGPE